MTFGGAFGGAWVGGMAQKVAATPARYYLHMDGAGYVNCGADSSLQDLVGTAFMVDFWVRVEQVSHYLLHKAPFRDGSGWGIDNLDGYTNPMGSHWYPSAWVTYSDGQAYSYLSYSVFDIPVNTWAHIAVAFDPVTKRAYIAVNGTWCTYQWQDTVTGTPVSDAGQTLWIGAEHGHDGGPANGHHGDFAWLRISNAHRWTIGQNFTAPEMAAAPAVDGNTLELWAFDDGSGAAAAASVTPANAGTLVGAVTWGEH